MASYKFVSYMKNPIQKHDGFSSLVADVGVASGLPIRIVHGMTLSVRLRREAHVGCGLL